jgi:uncharacterized membrane protein
MKSSLLTQLDHERIVAAIAAAEKKSSGEVRVHVHHRRVKDPMHAGKKIFEKLGMTKTIHRNGVLLFVAPKSKTFAILGDTGIHEKCGDEFWTSVADVLRRHFQEGKFTDGIVAAVETVGDRLAEHFPRSPEDKDELPDEIDES